MVCERRSGAESCTFCGPLDVDSVGSLAALILGVLLIWRSPAHRLRPLVIAHSSSPTRHRPTCSRFLHPPGRQADHEAATACATRLWARTPSSLFGLPVSNSAGYCRGSKSVPKVGLLHALPVRLDARCLPIVPPRLMSALGLPPCPAALGDSVNLATAALTVAVGGMGDI